MNFTNPRHPWFWLLWRYGWWLWTYLLGGLFVMIIGVPIVLLTSHPPVEVAVAVALPFVIFVYAPLLLFRWYLRTREFRAYTAKNLTLESAPPHRLNLGLWTRVLTFAFGSAFVVAAFVDSVVGLNWAVPWTLGIAIIVCGVAIRLRTQWVTDRLEHTQSRPVRAIVRGVRVLELLATAMQPQT